MINSLIKPDWKSRLIQAEQLFVGFSGGLDSTVLLHNVAHDPTLRERVRAIHVHHGLSAHADAWVIHCEQFCNTLGINLIVSKVHFEGKANIEERAREARFEIFSSYLSEQNSLLLAHHSDDQAETVLLHLLRGTGIEGLAGMSETRPLAKGLVHRPFLHLTRSDLEAYAKAHHLSWIEDESNQNEAFSRNYLRHSVLPLLQANWPGAVTSLAQSARHCQEAKANLAALAVLDCEMLAGRTLSVVTLKAIDHARLVNVLREWLKYHHIRLSSAKQMDRLINEVIFASRDAMPCVSFGEVIIRRYQQTLYLCENNTTIKPCCIEWFSFPNDLIRNDGVCLTVSSAMEGMRILPNSKVEVRFRLGGESLRWHGQTKSLKKLWQQWGIPPWLRDFIPLIFINDRLASVVGFAVGDEYYAKNGAYVYQIREKNATTIN